MMSILDTIGVHICKYLFPISMGFLERYTCRYVSLVRRVIAPLNLIPSPHKSRLNFLGIRFIARVLLACSVYQAQVKLCTHSPSAT